jgi:hypothetical protein
VELFRQLDADVRRHDVHLLVLAPVFLEHQVLDEALQEGRDGLVVLLRFQLQVEDGILQASALLGQRLDLEIDDV